MKNKETKINFYSVTKNYWKLPDEEDSVVEPFWEIKNTLEYIVKLSKKKRFYNLKDNKFCFIDSIRINNNVCEGFFKSARDKFRPNLINKLTGGERSNPKEKTEGDIEKTHFVIKIDESENEVYLFLENNHTGISINSFVNYLQFFSKEYANKNNLGNRYSIKYLIIARNNFLNELKKLERARIAELYVDKQILGNHFLNFSNRTVPVQHEIMLTVKAQKGEDIKNFAVDAYNTLTGKKAYGIKKIRIYGQDENGNKTLVDTSFMGQVDFISTKLDNDTGEAISQLLLNGITEIAMNF
jgi:hypothetical protein